MTEMPALLIPIQPRMIPPSLEPRVVQIISFSLVMSMSRNVIPDSSMGYISKRMRLVLVRSSVMIMLVTIPTMRSVAR